MSVLSVVNLVKTYGEKVLFDHISFTISDKQRIGLIGVNGTGKSTLLKVIAGLEPVEAGEIIHAKQFRIEYLPQHPELQEDLTVLEQVYFGDSPLMQAMRNYELALHELEADPANPEKQKKLLAMQQKVEERNAWEAVSAAKAILNRLGITNYAQPVKELSGGQKKRVAIAKAFIQEADLLILDEPTNHLDHDIIEWLESYLSQYNKALLLVTHDRYFLNRVTNRILELDHGKIYSYDGNYETYLEKKAEREEQALADEQKRQNLLRRELAWLRRGAKARTTKQKARIQRVEELRGQQIAIPAEKLDIALGATRLGRKVLELKEVTKRLGDKKLIDRFSYLVVPRERLGIVGPNGSGKSTLLNLFARRLEPDAGTVETGETVNIGYYTQDHAEMDMNQRVIDYIQEAAEVVKTAQGDLITAEQMLERFLFNRYMQRTYIHRLSGGERRRLYLLRVLMGAPNVLLLDEPTNDLDTQTLRILEDYLEQFPGAVIAVSHDRYFLDRVADRLLAFEGGGAIRVFEGSYSDYLEQRRMEKQLSASSRPERDELEKQPPKKERRKKLSYHEQREWEQIEDRIAALEERHAELQQQIAQAGSDYERIRTLYEEQQQVKKELDQAIERWAELSLLMEEGNKG
ncbi:ABC-F family ATP-binding cassette domain-containing protein [Brevibacillus sp. SYP-B805]|uniref:ABC-F family ATP-binding cassette domain-containing protein n=1 Tax=Brevibacillus sp. SYP-B805 TaxID=1578199 RepID=UPI0013EBFF0C|nr:ABC-F family ATP-binding cassette domain-containing protein [Brevibacillus sp. SYP-B805]NGQ95836.1 ABC-F family ATP-binding cassette domain-containing protein [Brevibacillus sp. SYP-B805]